MMTEFETVVALGKNELGGRFSCDRVGRCAPVAFAEGEKLNTTPT
jgi:hypothetical protein